jgi:periplasmic protein TonB
MKRAVTLYEFMPYGAPELLESRQRHMSQALLITCASLLALCALAGGIASLIHVTPSEPVARMPTISPIDPQVIVEAPPAPPASYVAHPPVPDAVPVPVPDPVAPPTDPPLTPSADPTGTGSTGVTTPGDVTATPGDADVWPSPDAPPYVEELPTVVKRVLPIYPQFAKDAGVEGLVMVKVLVGKDGRVLDVRLAEKFQVPMLNEAALTAARAWIFTPGLASGRPVMCWTAIPFRFRLH